MRLNEEQMVFLRMEFGLHEADIASMDKQKWQSLRFDCLDIVIDETCDLEKNGRDIDDWSDRAEMAQEIADLRYIDVFGG